jgi:hypothetical protein
MRPIPAKQKPRFSGAFFHLEAIPKTADQFSEIDARQNTQFRRSSESKLIQQAIL